MAVSRWTVDPGFSGPPSRERLREDLSRALAGSLDLDDRLRRREDSYRDSTEVLALEPRVTVVTGASESSSVLEVRTYDRPGALFRLATAIADAGLDIVGARADSLGSNVIDVFYVRDASGRPLDQIAQDDVVKRLLEVARGPETAVSPGA